MIQESSAVCVYSWALIITEIPDTKTRSDLTLHVRWLGPAGGLHAVKVKPVKSHIAYEQFNFSSDTDKCIDGTY